MKQKNKSVYTVWQNIRYMLGMTQRRFKKLLLLMAAGAVCSVLLPVLGMLLPKIVVDLLTSRAGAEGILAVVGGMTLGLAVLYFAEGYCQRHQEYGVNNLRKSLMWEVFGKSLRCDYKSIENADSQALYEKAMGNLDWDRSSILALLPDVLKILSGVLVFLFTRAVLSSFNPLIVVFLLVMAVIQYWANRRAVRYEQGTRDESSRASRKLWYIGSVAQDTVSGKDIRLYNMQGWFEPAWRRQMQAVFFNIMGRVNTRYMGSNFITALLNMLRDGLSYVYIIYETAGGRIALGDAVLFLGAVTSLSGFISNIVTGLSAVMQDSLEVCNMRQFLDLKDEPEPENPAPLPKEGVPLSIEFQDVCFRYPGDEKDTLHNLRFVMRGNEHAALVGLNGAGKTTIVKLLCGFYRPDSGRIFIGGTDSRSFRRDDLFTLFSAVFQDMFILPFTIAENVAMDRAKNLDKKRVCDCLDQAGLGHLKTVKPKGIESLMLRLHGDDGIQLSGGQQQRLALARALYKDARILVLDEPTAALDPIAEKELYVKYQGLTAGKSALYISHRLASTRFCDTIFFLENGQIAEQGTHDALIALGGRYAALFEVQSHYYRENAAEGGAV